MARLGAPSATDLSLPVDHATVLYTSKLLQGSDGLCQGDSVPLARLGKYEILDVIGRGGMGTVYRARDPDIGRLVAIKAISGGFGDSPEFIQRFLREAQLVGRLQHPNIVTVYDVGESDGVAYIVMEYLEGESLERIITRARNLRIVHKVGYMVGVCRGLQYAHQRHVVHRDIKPSNILITKDGGVKILDFGVARFTDISEAARQTRTGVVVGTLAYMSPEQISGLTASESMDIWAVGVTTYELVSYRKPFSGESFPQLIDSILHEQPPPLRVLAPDCPPSLEKLVTSMLEKDPQLRLRSIDDFLPDLEKTYDNLAELSVRELLPLSVECLRSNDFRKAMELLQEILQIDSANAQARRLLEKVRSALEDTSVTAKLRSLVQAAKENLLRGDLSGARSAVESAIQIDSGYEPARELLEQLQGIEHRTRTVKTLLERASEKLAERDFIALEELAKQILALQPNNKDAENLLQQARAHTQPESPGVTVLGVLPAPTGFFAESAVSRSRFFRGDKVRFEKIQETLKFYRDHLNGEYQSLSAQARSTYYLWIASVILGLAALISGVILLFLKQFAAGSISAISTTFVYFIQRVFQQREDHYRSLATAKYQHLEYGNHWLLVIQSIDAIENPSERARRQGELVDVLTRKLATSPSDRSRRKQTATNKPDKTKPKRA